MNAIGAAIFGELMNRQAVFTTADVGEIVDGSPVWIARSLAVLSKEGLIAKVRRGLWAIARIEDARLRVAVTERWELLRRK
jgi:predicted transcriptional regulator of viral defense system